MADVIISEKPCSRCKEVKSVSEFHVSKDNSSGYVSHCKSCIAQTYQDRKTNPKQKKEKIQPENIEVFYEGPVIARNAARNAGMEMYFTGKPCGYGHIAQRYIKGGCTICKAAQRKRWRQENLEKHKRLMADWYQENKEQQNARSSAWAKQNTARCTIHHARWRAKNRERVRIVKKQWRDSNPERVAQHEKSRNAKRRTLVKFVVTSRMRGRMYEALRRIGVQKDGKSWKEFVPYTVDELIVRLKKTMPKGYCWADLFNGKLHVDHIIPIAAFNYSDPSDIDFQKCWQLKNLRLLPASVNCSKGAKLDKPFQPSFAGI